MRYCRFQTEDGPQYGEVVERNGELWIERLLSPPPEDTVIHLSSGPFDAIPFLTAILLAPVTPSKIVCVGRNYLDHAKELGNELPTEPLLFLKAPSSLLAPGGTIQIPPASARVDFEGELAVVIGKRARRIGSSEDVKQYIRGYTIVNDVTARDLQKKDGQWTRAKGFDTFCPVGPLVSNEFNPEAGVTLETRLNDVIRQHGTTRDLIFPIVALLRYITACMTLEPGDLVPTGTPAGVGPMQPGDRVSVTVEGIGTLSNVVDLSPA
jgi:2-keto-4-pentenoate hydratase/2-oxohepta-3-ene-1,7-dioic acid hydratase in catechol pathway